MTPPGRISELFRELDSTEADRAVGGLNRFADEAPIFIYGAGNAGKDVLRVLRAASLRVVGFLDQHAARGEWNDLPIRLPDDSSISLETRREAHVVVAIFNASVDIPPVVGMLRALGYGRVTTFLELHDQFAEELGDRFWLTARTFYKDREADAAAGYQLWADEKSRELCAAILEFRFTGRHEVLPPPDPAGQYLPADLPPWKAPLRFVDCGAYDGDTLAVLVVREVRIEALAAFEPDPVTFARLSGFVRAHSATLPETAALFPCGVDEATTQVRFASGEGTSSHISDKGDVVIQCVSLDEALPNFRPNLIKMDIEGAEYAALRGARRTIAADRPGLAICLYHRPEHLWQLPLRIREIVGDSGKFYLRAHGHNGLELVCYWLPD